MQPHVNLGIRFRTHFETFGPGSLRYFIRFKKAAGRLGKMKAARVISPEDYRKRMSDLRNDFKEGKQIMDFSVRRKGGRNA